MTPFLAASLEFRRKADNAGVTLDDLLDGLREDKEDFFREVYGEG